MRNTRYGILKMETVDGKVTPTTVPSSSRTSRAVAHLRRLRQGARQGEKYRMLEEKLDTRLYPFTPYTTLNGRK